MDKSDTYHRTWHLAQLEGGAELTEFEFASIRFREAFEHFVLQATRTSSGADLNFAELCVLHTIRMQAMPTGASWIARMLNRDDIPNIHYSLRKLANMGLIAGIKEKGSKNINYQVTDEGERVTQLYASIKKEVLAGQIEELSDFTTKISSATRMLTMLTGMYEESARIVATYSRPQSDPALNRKK